MFDNASAQTAIDALDGLRVEGYTVKARFAHSSNKKRGDARRVKETI